MLSVQFVQGDSVADLSPGLVGTPPTDGTSLAHLLIRLGRQDASGLVTVQRDDGLEATLPLSKGALQRPVLRGHDEDALLVQRLRAGGRIDGARLDAAVASARAERRPVSSSIFRAGLASVHDLAAALRAVRVELVRRCLARGQGRVVFDERDDVPRDPVALPLAPLLFGHYRERLEACTIKDVEPRLGAWLFRFPLATFETPLYAQGVEGELIEQYCTGNLNTRTVIDKGRLGPVRGGRLLLLLFAFDLLDARLQPLRVTQNLDVREAVDARLEAVQAGRPFEILDVHWTSHPAEIEDKHQQEVARFDAFLQREGLSEELADAVRRVRAALDQAWGVLSDPALRHAERARRYTRQQVEFAASFLNQQAELAIFRHDERTARRQLEAALDLTGDRRYVDALATLWQRIHGKLRT